MRQADVLVVGGGPAGLMAGLALAEGGVSVAILEKRSRQDLPVACGEAVSDWFFKRFGFSGDASWVKATVQRLEMIMPGGKGFYAPYPGYLLDRRGFEAHLLEAFIGAGGKVFWNEPLLSATKARGRWEVETSRGLWTCRVLLGCDGPKSRVASLLGWRARRWLLALQYKFPFNPFPDGVLRFYYTQDLPYGYLYLFPRGDELTVGVGGLRKGSYLKAYLEAFLRGEGLDPSRRFGSVAGLIPHAPLLWPPGGEGVLLCGDAAGFVHPMTKGGIHLACYSGREAALSLLALDERDWWDSELLERYLGSLKGVRCLNPRWHGSSVDLSLLPEEVLKGVGEAMEGRPYYALPVLEFLRRPSLLPWVPRLLRIQWRYASSHIWGW